MLRTERFLQPKCRYCVASTISPTKRDQNEMKGTPKRDRFSCASYLFCAEIPKLENRTDHVGKSQNPKIKTGWGCSLHLPYWAHITNKSRRSHIVFCHVAVFGQVLTKSQDPSSLSFKDPGALYAVFHDITSPGNDRFFRGSEKTVVLGLQKIAQSEHMSIPMTDPWEW